MNCDTSSPPPCKKLVCSNACSGERERERERDYYHCMNMNETGRRAQRARERERQTTARSSCDAAARIKCEEEEDGGRHSISLPVISREIFGLCRRKRAPLAYIRLVHVVYAYVYT